MTNETLGANWLCLFFLFLCFLKALSVSWSAVKKQQARKRSAILRAAPNWLNAWNPEAISSKGKHFAEWSLIILKTPTYVQDCTQVLFSYFISDRIVCFGDFYQWEHFVMLWISIQYWTYLKTPASVMNYIQQLHFLLLRESIRINTSLVIQCFVCLVSL